MSWLDEMRRTTPSALVALAAFVALTSPAGAISFSGIDAQSQYTGFSGPAGPDTPGIFTFDDTMNGANPSPEPGVVTGENGLPDVLGGVIDLELLLDTAGGYDPVNDILFGAPFVGTGGNEVVIRDQPGGTVLLAFDVVEVVVANVQTSGNLFSMGDPEGSSASANSLMAVSGGTLAASVGGVGMPALIHLIVNDPDPPVPSILTPGYLNDSFDSGFAGAGTANAGVNWAITIIPEPGTAGLVGLGLVALGVRARRRRA